MMESAYDEMQGMVSPDDFLDPRNRILFETISAMKNKGRDRIDILTLRAALDSRGLLRDAGGEGYIASITSGDTIASNARTYALLVRDCGLRRRIRRIYDRLSEDSDNSSLQISETIDRAGEEIFRLAESGASSDDGTDAPSLIAGTINTIIEKMDGACTDDTVSTGFTRLDSMLTGGFRPSDYVIVAARPSIGKTAFAISMLVHMLKEGKSIVLFSLEMSERQIGNKMLSAAAGVGLRSITKGSFSEAEFLRIEEAGNSLMQSSLRIFSNPGMRIGDIRTKARIMKRRGQCDLIMIDYMGLIESGLRNGTPRYEAMAYVSRMLKIIARELDVPVIALCQVTRDSEEREPMLSNLRDSGSIEQDADIVMFLHRKRELTADEKARSPRNRYGFTLLGTKVIVAKQRNGETGSFILGYTPATTGFADTDVHLDFFEPQSRDKQR